MNNQPIPSELVQQDPDFADLVEEFVDGLTARLETMEQAAQQHNFENVRTCAHQLKGSAGGYGYPCLTEKAGELEQHAVAEALGERTRSIDELRDLISRVVVV